MTDTLTITNPIPTTNGGEGGGAGTAGGIFFINVIPGETEGQLTLDKTWNEIKTAVDNGMLPVLLQSVNEGSAQYSITIVLYIGSYSVDEGYKYVIGTAQPTFTSTDPDGVLTQISYGDGGK